MTKTVLELTDEELGAYHPCGERVTPPDKERWERAWQLARSAADLLRVRFCAVRIVVFGSLVNKRRFTPWSDVDLAAWGIPPDDFYRAVAVITGLSSEFEVDLVDPQMCPPALIERINHEGIEL
ncbi:MAG: nucleotidyltransferase domain-containing protein [Desulfobacterales bacterium]|jgi:predicted nucleotidyltransferase